MALLERHLGFVTALRAVGISASLAEALDAVAALGVVGWDDRERVREVYAATLVKRHSQRPTFDAVFELWFPRLIGEGVDAVDYENEKGLRDTPTQLAQLRSDVVEALAAEVAVGVPEATPEAPQEGSSGQDSGGEGSGGESRGGQDSGGEGATGEGSGHGSTPRSTEQLAVEAVGRLGRMPGRQPGQQSWSAYTTLRRLGSEEVTRRLVDALIAQGVERTEAGRRAEQAVSRFEALVTADAMRRLAAERDPGELALSTVRPMVEKLEFTAAKREDLDEMRRALLPLARQLAARLTKEQHSRRRGPLDFRRTVRASMSTGGVPLETHQRPRRPHRTDLVVLCDVSGSVANFAQFTLMLVFALREQFTGVRAFTFVDTIVEVTDSFVPGADMGDVLNELSARSAHAALFGRTNYGAAFSHFLQQFPDALSSRSTLLVLGDARSNYADLNESVLAEMAETAKRSLWLNPEHPRHWGNGDSAAHVYGGIVEMTECRNLEQLAEFVHDLV